MTTQEALKYFGPTGGSVINISSTASVNAVPNSVVYAATKGALDSITRVLAKDWGPGRSGSTQSLPVALRLRVYIGSASLEATSKSR